jgi:MATE family multidrug resistance protein
MATAASVFLGAFSMATHLESTPSSAHGGFGGIREVATLAYPVVLTQLAVSAMFVIDTAMVGRLGATEMGAVGYGGIWMWTALCTFIGTSTGVQTFVAQAHGAGRSAQCGAWAWQGIYALVPLVGIGVGLFALTIPQLLAWLGPSPELQEFAATYIRARSFGAVALCAASVIASFFRGLGDTRTPLHATLVATSVNAVLDYGLIFGKLGLPAWGVRGAGAATAISEWLYLGWLLVALLRNRVRHTYATDPVRPQPATMRRLFRTSAPIGGQWVIEMLSFALFSTLVARMGDVSAAASQAFLTLLSLSFMQALGISIAAATLVGRYVGAGDLAAAERSHRSAVALGLMLGALVAVAFVSFPEALLRVFTDDARVLTLGRRVLWVGALFQVFDALQMIAGGSLRGAGDTRWPFAAQALLAWGLFLPLGYVLGVLLEGGLFGAWSGGTIYVVILAGTLLVRFQRGAWRSIQI